jgi:ribosome maturation factor RimP
LKKDDIISALYVLISPIVEALGLELVEIQYHRRTGGRSILRIFIDKEGSVTLDDCERLSREVEAEMDVEDIIPESYTIEVSSPGLDRPLRKIEDYRKNIGKLVKLSTNAPIKNQRFFIGRMSKVEDDTITLILEDGEELKIPFSQVSKANLKIEF